MPRGQLFINSEDAYTEWGISLDSTSLSALMTPASKKEWITNEVRTENGVRYVTGIIPMNKQRDITLTFNLTASDETDFHTKYAAFCTDVLEGGLLNIQTSFQPNVVYRCVYEQCSQFTQFRQQMAFFTLKLVEPNPNNRALTNANTRKGSDEDEEEEELTKSAGEDEGEEGKEEEIKEETKEEEETNSEEKR